MKIYQSYLYSILFCTVILTGCSNVNNDSFSVNKDPFEDANRQIYDFNARVDTLLLEPVAFSYNKAVPKSGKTAISNHVSWAMLPNTALNSALQGKWENAALSGLRFSVNALTLGFADLNPKEGLPVSQDFGNTMDVYNVPEGSYVVLPILGGKTSRHAFGQILNLFLNPYSIFEEKKAISQAVSIQPILSTISWRATNFDIVNDIKYNSLDGYVRARSAYYQNRFANVPSSKPQRSDADTLFDNLDFEG